VNACSRDPLAIVSSYAHQSLQFLYRRRVGNNCPYGLRPQRAQYTLPFLAPPCYRYGAWIFRITSTGMAMSLSSTSESTKLPSRRRNDQIYPHRSPPLHGISSCLERLPESSWLFIRDGIEISDSHEHNRDPGEVSQDMADIAVAEKCVPGFLRINHERSIKQPAVVPNLRASPPRAPEHRRSSRSSLRHLRPGSLPNSSWRSGGERLWPRGPSNPTELR